MADQIAQLIVLASGHRDRDGIRAWLIRQFIVQCSLAGFKLLPGTVTVTVTVSERGSADQTAQHIVLASGTGIRSSFQVAFIRRRQLQVKMLAPGIRTRTAFFLFITGRRLAR